MKKLFSCIFLFIVGFVSSYNTIAQALVIDEIIVTASRIPQKFYTVGGSLSVLDAELIDSKNNIFLSDAIKSIPGLSVSTSGPSGSLTQIRMRGAESNHTLVILDGVEVGDPFNAGEFEFSSLLSADISRVEVLRGPQSSLWGSEALGGVVNISTRPRGDLTGYWGSLSSEVGSFGTTLIDIKGGHANGFGEVYGSIGFADIVGISASPTGEENDGYENLTMSLSSNLEWDEDLSLELTIRHVNSSVEQDSQDFNFGSITQGQVIDADSVRDSNYWYGKLTGKLSTFDNRWNHQIGIGFTDSQSDSFTDKLFSFGSEGQKRDIEYSGNFIAKNTNNFSYNISTLIEYEKLEYENILAIAGPGNQLKRNSQLSYALENRISFDEQLFVALSVRYDDNQLFRNSFTYRGTVAWFLPNQNLKLRSSYGTGVAQPGFYELYGFNPSSFVGNPDLRAERSVSWEVGFDFSFNDDLGLLSMTYFNANLEDEIFTKFTVFPFTTANRSETSTRNGIELSLQYSPVERVTGALSYTYTDAKDGIGFREVRRPRHIANLSISSNFFDDRLKAHIDMNYNGKFLDNEFVFSTPETVSPLSDYVLLSLSSSFAITDYIDFVGRIENALDQKYENVLGFASPGVGVYFGLSFDFGGTH